MVAILVRHLGFLDFPKTSENHPKSAQKQLKQIKTPSNDLKTSKILQESCSLIFLIIEMEILKNMLVKIWLPLKHQVT